MILRITNKDIPSISELMGIFFGKQSEEFIKANVSIDQYLCLIMKLPVGKLVIKVELEAQNGGVMADIVEAKALGLSIFGVVRNKANDFLFNFLNNQKTLLHCERVDGNIFIKVNNVEFNQIGVSGEILQCGFKINL